MPANQIITCTFSGAFMDVVLVPVSPWTYMAPHSIRADPSGVTLPR